jgi:GntR family transcriptional repressor for pyruvate dehydrogenase complex
MAMSDVTKVDLSSSSSEAMWEIQPVHRVSLSDKIVEQIIDLISRDVLKPGDRLPSERDLCKRFGVGRTSLREALRSLTVMGILEGRVGEGTFVNQGNGKHLEKTLQWGILLDEKRVQDLIETRLMLESESARLAATRATDQDLQLIGETVDGMAHTLSRPEAYLAHDLEFHLLIAQASKNSILCSLLGTTRGYLQEWIKRTLGQESNATAQMRAELSVRQHEMVVEALSVGNAEQARQAMSDHILSSSADLQSVL